MLCVVSFHGGMGKRSKLAKVRQLRSDRVREKARGGRTEGLGWGPGAETPLVGKLLLVVRGVEHSHSLGV